ncbi:sigma-54-dependent Fis family transcriptional regulator [Streptomyces yaizuensis]|uniref:AAA family ATPase n=1 Tax=Streptomyces yaizuensis TaxID=2989713 RepID=A0ABQ5NZ04_9ACTN|nr:helix-turn-helix domain-containing protein [Streptomyces sp. YSPA8]GLF95467.1 AAA family ATPase [Streptomyces sp. YSPA8]
MRPDDTTLRPEIAHSWWRSERSGLTPTAPNLRVEPDAVDRRGRLRAAAGPVLAELAGQLGDADFCVLLADRESRIVDLSCGARPLRDRLEALGVVAGGVFLEETTGTNSIATAHELRRGVAVHGDEHYLEPFKRFSCYGHPITHPVTRRLQGVLDITCHSGSDSPLLAPLVARAARDIEERLLRTARAAEQRMLAAFQAAAGRDRAVLVLGEGVVLATPAAVELLDPVDHVRLRGIAADAGPGREAVGASAGAGAGAGAGDEYRLPAVELSSGRTLAVTFRAVAGSDRVLFTFHRPRSAAPPAHRHGPRSGSGSLRQSAAPAAPPVYVGGVPGTGRTTTARSLAGTEPARVITLDASEAAVRGEAAWLTDLDRALAGLEPAPAEQAAGSGPGLLVVEDVQLLPAASTARLRRIMEGRPGPRIALTGPPRAELTGPHAALAADCPDHIELPRLRDRTAELPELVRTMVDALLDPLVDAPGTGGRPRFTPAALAALSGHPWPGNLRELHTVVRSAVERRSAGDITPRDLPERYRVSPGLRALTPLERAEYDTIAAALLACDGNKLRAAKRLGISRTTLYNRMRALRITA